jgi:ferric-dicitrate binding protein FerR (iron transport regulator)
MNMDDLIVKYLLGSANAEETTRLERWLAADERNMGRLRQFRTLWDLSGRTAGLARPDTQEALGRLRQRLERMGEVGNGIRVGRPVGESERGMLRKGLAAAVLVGLLCAGIVIFVVERTTKVGAADKGKGGGTAIVAVTVTVPGKDTLPDGSVVTLAPHSKFIYTPGLTGDSRTISLEGDADFSVSRDLSRPFVVLAGDIAVRVLGTSFLVTSGPDSTEVTVTTGVVQVSRDKDSIIVRAGQRLTAYGKKGGMVLRDRGKESVGVRDGSKRDEGEERGGGIKSGLVVKGGGEPAVKGGAIKSGGTKSGGRESDPKQVMRSIIDNLVKEKIVPDRASVEWFGLDLQHFIVNGRVMPVGMRRAYVAKYIKTDGQGYYFEAEKGGKVSGTGYFFDRKDLY